MTEVVAEEDWIEEESEGELYPVEYDITSSPNDFNVRTLFDLIESGTVKIPGFQRNYVWDIKKASKLIESIIIGLPVPQVFFYEKGKNNFLVIDGQQRLMTIYYFIKKRFPRSEKRTELRRIFDEKGSIPPEVLVNDDYFNDFELKLGTQLTEITNRLDGLDYDSLDRDDKRAFELRTIRCVVIKQHEPKDDSSMYEIFYRLNTGGMNLKAQEIRTCLYYSDFYNMLNRINLDDRWRRLTRPEPDIHMRDIEVLLRGFAMLIDGKNYNPPMVRFLNSFSESSKKIPKPKIDYYEKFSDSFLNQSSNLPDRAFSSQSGRFSVSMYEAVFTTVCEEAFYNDNLDVKPVDPARLDVLKNDNDFVKASQYQTTSKERVNLRLQRAREILLG